jgi:hypothetical protein
MWIGPFASQAQNSILTVIKANGARYMGWPHKWHDSDAVSVAQASTVAAFLWPTFIEIEGAVFLAVYEEDARRSVANEARIFHSLSDVEASVNHTHVFDRFLHGAGLEDGNITGIFWDNDHPDFKVACDLGKTAVQTWAHKLKRDFPQYRFRVYFTQEDNPIVRFHRVHKDGDFWINGDDRTEDIAAGKILIIDTADLT